MLNKIMNFFKEQNVTIKNDEAHLKKSQVEYKLKI